MALHLRNGKKKTNKNKGPNEPDRILIAIVTLFLISAWLIAAAIYSIIKTDFTFLSATWKVAGPMVLMLLVYFFHNT